MNKDFWKRLNCFINSTVQVRTRSFPCLSFYKSFPLATSLPNLYLFSSRAASIKIADHTLIRDHRVLDIKILMISWFQQISCSHVGIRSLKLGQIVSFVSAHNSYLRVCQILQENHITGTFACFIVIISTAMHVLKRRRLQRRSVYDLFTDIITR